MAYSDKVIDHYENPRNVGSFEKDDPTVGTGMVGAPACGDVMKLQIKVDHDTGIITDARFKTYGCGSAIASSSLVTEWVKGKTLNQAGSIKNSEIATELALPPVKIHCSILAEDAIKAAKQKEVTKLLNEEKIKKQFDDVAKDGEAFRKKLQESLQIKSTAALEVSDIRTKEGAAAVFALQAGRVDPAVEAAREQIKKLEEIKKAIRENKPDETVDILGGAE